ncbi:hypothetical protein F5X99DRAFT_429325 [Biscogniauxia marginata]|nr:hypothetical protein F5X99DRAFT_429325 [Biscogniauxia marginata]
MRREQITLPTLQLAAATFFAVTCHAETYCVDQASKVVAKPNCDAGHAPGDFFLVQGPPDAAIGTVIPSGQKVGRETLAERRAAMMADKGFVSGGFGKKDDDDNNNGGGAGS